MQRGLVMAGVMVLLGCTAPAEPPSWRVMPLQRYAPHDGLAVVNQPDGYGPVSYTHLRAHETS